MAREIRPANAEQIAFRDELLAAGLILASEVPGLYGRSAIFEDVRARLDALVTTLTADQSAEPLRFPPLLPRRQMEASGYLGSFPHLAGAIFAFEGDEDDARVQAERAATHANWSEFQKMSDLVLAPAACYPVYPAIARRGPLAPGGVVIDTGAAWVFRHEPAEDPARLQMFRMRELVRIGAPDEVLAWRDDARERGVALLHGLGLAVQADRASDPFFGRGGRMLAANQRSSDLKYELLAPIAGPEHTAVVSINYHQDHFGHAHGLVLADGSPAHTGCIGFGEERIVLALFSAHGLDPARWPAKVREQLWNR
jgi:seryl-tRNA synthetase